MSHQQPGPTGHQPTGQWGAPPPLPLPPKKSKTLPIILGVVGFVVVIGVAGAATGDKEDKAAAASPTTTAAQPAGKQPAATSAPASHAAAPKPKPKPKAQTVLSVSGSGMKSTATFKVEDDWDLQYSYDCSAFGVQGNFIVKQGGDLGDIYLNELGAKGSDVTHLHDGGSMHLEVTSECKWTIKVIDLP